jgi:hypothetical protein
VFSLLFFSKASRYSFFIVSTFIVLKQGFAQDHVSSLNINSGKGSLSKNERVVAEAERKQLQSFVVNLLKDYGCKDFEKKAFEAILEQLQNNPQPLLSFRDRHKAMISNLRVYNESDRPAGSFEPAKKEFSNLLLDLNELTTETLFSYYLDDSNGTVSPMSSYKIAVNLELEKVTSIETPKKKILDILKKLHSLIDDDHLDMGCRNEDYKNFLMLDLPRGYVSLNDVYRSQNAPQASVVAEPKVEVKPQSQPKVEAKPEAKIEAKIEPKVEPKIEPKVESKPEPKFEPKKEPKPEPKPEPKQEIKPEITVTHEAPVEAPIKEKIIEYSKTTLSKRHQESVEKEPPAAAKPQVSAPTATPDKESNNDIVERYLSLTRAEVKPYMKSGWDEDYEEFITAFILNGHTRLLRNFHQFEDVCDDISRHNTPQKKARFVAKFFKALAMVETGSDPRIETRENTDIRYRPKTRDFPSVSGKPYIQHSVGLFQLDESDYLYNNCQEIDYEKDVSIGYSNSRVRKTNWNYGGVHVEYYGDTRKSILNPFVNAACAVRILENKIPNGLISETSYWAPLRPDRGHAAGRSKLKKLIKKEIPGC